MFIDTANVEEIKKVMKLGIVKGVTTNPSILSAEKYNEARFLEALGENSLLVFFQVKGFNSDEMFDYFISLKEELNYDFGVKIPITMAGLETIYRIKNEYPDTKILGTVIYTSAQGILAVKAGCDYLAPYYNRIGDQGGDSNQVIAEIRSFIEDNSSDSKIMAASFKAPSQVVSALSSGSHTFTISYDIFAKMLENKSVVSDLAVFNACDY